MMIVMGRMCRNARTYVLSLTPSGRPPRDDYTFRNEHKTTCIGNGWTSLGVCSPSKGSPTSLRRAFSFNGTKCYRNPPTCTRSWHLTDIWLQTVNHMYLLQTKLWKHWPDLFFFGFFLTWPYFLYVRLPSWKPRAGGGASQPETRFSTALLIGISLPFMYL